MSVLVAESLKKEFAGDALFKDVSFQIGRGDRVALIGLNGSGKSTLLKILAELEEASSGEVRLIGSVRVGYLSQEPEMESDATLLEEMLKAFNTLRAQEAELRTLENEMAAHGSAPERLHRYDELMEQFRHGGGYEYESQIHQVLAGMGFSPDDERRVVAHLSGGQRARAALARLLLEEPDLMLLDEPTNHLDFAAVEWLEDYLSRWKKSFIIVSHDRYFLDKLAQRTLELDFGTLHEYPGNYTKYLSLREEYRERQWKLYEEQQEFIQKSEEFIRANLKSGPHRANQAQARQKQLEKLVRIEKPKTAKKLHLWIDPKEQSGERVLKIRDLVVGYGQNTLFQCSNVNLNRGERAAILGPNGSGKTSLLKIILEQVQPLSGHIELGQGVQFAYFRQSQMDAGEGDKTVLQAFIDDQSQTNAEARSFLGQFLFHGEDVFKPLQALSGGERSRVELARLAQLGGNLLLLDEPTNHLDIDSREMLQDALKEYPGTILLVSHDRYLIQALATQIWEIRDGQLRVYEGNYEYYKRKRAEEIGKAPLPKPKQERVRARQQADLKKQREKERKRLQKLEAEMVHAIERLESEIIATEKALEAASYDGDHQSARELHVQYEQKKIELEKTTMQWAQVAEQLAAI
ncbi:ABC-F family ATP-binding cassette domain-containing protein [Candidatus Acetothermia bacterium]|nr:ABC-F family ATP-binding cassette domain-containing protein [Candidatus Acetothermia bacterium]